MTIQAKPIHEESTYQLLVESEEKRGLIEAFVYLMLMLATIATIWQFGRQPVTFPEIGIVHAEKIAAITQS